MDFERAGRLDGSLVDIDGECGQLRAGRLPQQTFEDGAADLGQLPDGVDARMVETAFRGRSDAPDEADGKGFEEGALVLWRHDNDAVGFGHLRGHFGQVLGAGNPDRERKADFVPDASTDRDGDLGGRPEEVDSAGDVEERLVDGDALDPGSEVVKDGHDLVAELLVAVEVATDEGEVGAEFAGRPPGHAAAHAVLSGFVGGGEHDATPDRDGPAPQRRVQQLLHRGVERIEVGVQDRRRSSWRGPHAEKLDEHMFVVHEPENSLTRPLSENYKHDCL